MKEAIPISTIRQLDPHLANLIAAGEVVERPASVVKELVENSIDAGSKHITVEIHNGGLSMIRVTDDGCGISPEQAQTAFLRHATSKISSEFDLEAIGTLGFRGEALAAIAAVSQIELLTCTPDADLGISLVLEGGKLISQEEAGCPVGTTMIVRDLFFNTPARRKFMKRDQAESAAVFIVVQREALAHPEISIKFIRDEKQDMLTPGDSQLKSALYAVFGRDIALGFLPVSGSGENMSVEGFASMPSCCRGSRSYQHFFVNGRYIKSLMMQSAVEEAYKNQKMVGKFPGCVLHLTCGLGAVDVNVHPTKTEVKFVEERQVFSAIYHAVLSALEGDSSRPSALPDEKQEKLKSSVSAAASSVFQNMSAEEFHEKRQSGSLRVESPRVLGNTYPSPRTAAPLPGRHRHPPSLPRGRISDENLTQGVDIAPPEEEDSDFLESAAPPAVPVEPPRKEQLPQVPPVESVPEENCLPEEAQVPWVIRGELFRTYILVEQGDTVVLIDKHAAHERLNFDRLRGEEYQPMIQELLIPVTFTPSPEERAVLLENTPLLEEFGFLVEEFGSTALIVRQAPDDVDESQIQPALSELAQRILTTGCADPASARDELLHTIACKAAIKGGWKSSPEELERVAGAVMTGQVKYCPHGRPVATEMTKKQLEKRFKRS